MKRKVNLVGNSTLTISLPSEFTKIAKLEKGDELQTSFTDSEITYSTKLKKSDSKKKIEIDISSFSYHVLSRTLAVIYHSNYSKIVLIHNTSTESNKIVRKFARPGVKDIRSAINILTTRFIGAEIISQTSEKTTIEFLTDDNERDLNAIRDRIFFLLEELINELSESIKSNKIKQLNNDIYSYHDNIVRFIDYFLRKLNHSKIPESEKRTLVSMYLFIDKIIDKVRHITRKLAKNPKKCSPKIEKYISETFNSFLKLLNSTKEKDFSKTVNLMMETDLYKIKENLEKESVNSFEASIFGDLDWVVRGTQFIVEYALTKSLPN